MIKILLIDHDHDFGEVIKDLLVENHYEVDFCDCGHDAIEQEKLKSYDLLLINLYLTDCSGLDLLETIKKHNQKSRVIIMTNSSDDADEIKALKLGVDEYFRKDSSINVILQRIKNVIEKPSSLSEDRCFLECDCEKLVVDYDNSLILKDNKSVHLTQLELDLLVYLMKNRNKMLSRENILESVWHFSASENFIDARTVDSHIKNLRKKLKLNSIHSIRGVGYLWHEK